MQCYKATALEGAEYATERLLRSLLPMQLGLRLLRVVDVIVDTTRIALATSAATVLLLSLHCVVATVELFRTQGLGEGDCWKVEG